MAQQIWKSVPGYIGLYEVSDNGGVRSVERTHAAISRWGSTTLYTRKGKQLQPQVGKDGYVRVNLCREGVVRGYRVSRLVLLAFVGAADGREAGHMNNDVTDNRLSNLRWQTRIENEAQKSAQLRRPRSTRGMFDMATIRIVREMRDAGMLLRDISALFGCHVSTVGYACTNATWKEPHATQLQ